ncbi:hypothetical protein AVEN_74191-1 [Araneus ventricosus]|uniref:Uncharacterized protein n=1 Tax=Araneus ventricosus TaxID=182803 RepID=A0A4Y2IDH0_ARAVE|nr:hypothetical protein AVEN_74191-1 [Araneus ventricosus]
MPAILTVEDSGCNLVGASPDWEIFLCVEIIGFSDKVYENCASAGPGGSWASFGSRLRRCTDDPKEEVTVIISEIYQQNSSSISG